MHHHHHHAPPLIHTTPPPSTTHTLHTTTPHHHTTTPPTTPHHVQSLDGPSIGAKQDLPGAYERLILEVMRGDQTNFVHLDELVASWRIFTPALKALAERKEKPEPYPFGSEGPESEKDFASRFGFANGFGKIYK